MLALRIKPMTFYSRDIILFSVIQGVRKVTIQSYKLVYVRLYSNFTDTLYYRIALLFSYSSFASVSAWFRTLSHSRMYRLHLLKASDLINPLLPRCCEFASYHTFVFYLVLKQLFSLSLLVSVLSGNILH